MAVNEQTNTFYVSIIMQSKKLKRSKKGLENNKLENL